MNKLSLEGPRCALPLSKGGGRGGVGVPISHFCPLPEREVHPLQLMVGERQHGPAKEYLAI